MSPHCTLTFSLYHSSVPALPCCAAGVESQGQLPSSSYRLGVRPAPLHELYDARMTAALRRALCQFDRRLRGFVGPEALLHGVETRTSAPVSSCGVLLLGAVLYYTEAGMLLVLRTKSFRLMHLHGVTVKELYVVGNCDSEKFRSSTCA